MRSRGPKASERGRPRVIQSRVHDTGEVTLSAHLGPEPTEEEIKKFVAAMQACVPADYREWDKAWYAEFGYLYRIAWAVQDHHWRFRAEGNPLSVWHAIAILNDPRVRAEIGSNGARLTELRAVRDTGKRRASPEILREIEIRQWIGDPFPEWVADYLARVARRIIDPLLSSASSYGTAISQALELSRKGGGGTAHARIKDPAQRRKATALRLQDRASRLGTKFTNKEIGEIFNVDDDTVKDWKKKRGSTQ